MPDPATALEAGMAASDNQLAATVDANSKRFISPSLNDALELGQFSLRSRCAWRVRTSLPKAKPTIRKVDYPRSSLRLGDGCDAARAAGARRDDAAPYPAEAIAS